MSLEKIFVHSKLAKILCLLLAILLFCLLFVNIEQDLPPWSLGFYQPADEGAYSLLAINDMKYGSINPQGLEYPTYTSLHLRTYLVGNAMSIIGFRLFGNNYYGMRIPYIAFSIINLILMVFIIRILAKKNKVSSVWRDWAVIAALLFLACDFMYFLAGRTAEPSSVRLLFVQITVLIFISMPNSYRVRFFLMGIVIIASVFTVYITNVFLIAATGALLLFILWTEGKKQFFSGLIFFAAGCLSVYLLVEIYYFSVWNTSAIINMLRSVNEFSSNTGYTIIGTAGGNLYRELLKRFIKYFSANILLYNLPLLFIFLLFLPANLVIIFKYRDKDMAFVYAIIFSFLLQTLAVEDCIGRKFLVVSFTWIVSVFLTFFHIDSIRKWYIACGTWIREKWFDKAWNIISGVYVSLVTLFCAAMALFRLVIVEDGTRMDYTIIDKLSIALLGLIPLFVFSIVLIRNMTKGQKTIMFKGLVLLFGLSMVLNLSLRLRYIHIFPQYTEKEAMLNIAEEVDGQYVLGGFQIGFALYNNMRPIISTPEMTRVYMEKNPDLLYLDYEDETLGMRGYFDNFVFAFSDYTAYNVMEIERNYLLYSDRRNMALYQAKPKWEVVRIYQQLYQKKVTLFEETLEEMHEAVSTAPIEERLELLLEMEEYRGTSEKMENPYPNLYGGYFSDVITKVYTDIYGDIIGNIYEDIYGDIHGDIYGDIHGLIHGDIYGNVYGNLYVAPTGELHGELVGVNRTGEIDEKIN